jgi:hypothetical protein
MLLSLKVTSYHQSHYQGKCWLGIIFDLKITNIWNWRRKKLILLNYGQQKKKAFHP